MQLDSHARQQEPRSLAKIQSYPFWCLLIGVRECLAVVCSASLHNPAQSAAALAMVAAQSPRSLGATAVTARNDDAPHR
jgi:hypothetical protein